METAVLHKRLTPTAANTGSAWRGDDECGGLKGKVDCRQAAGTLARLMVRTCCPCMTNCQLVSKWSFKMSLVSDVHYCIVVTSTRLFVVFADRSVLCGINMCCNSFSLYDLRISSKHDNL